MVFLSYVEKVEHFGNKYPPPLVSEKGHFWTAEALETFWLALSRSKLGGKMSFWCWPTLLFIVLTRFEAGCTPSYISFWAWLRSLYRAMLNLGFPGVSSVWSFSGIPMRCAVKRKIPTPEWILASAADWSEGWQEFQWWASDGTKWKHLPFELPSLNRALSWPLFQTSLGTHSTLHK